MTILIAHRGNTNGPEPEKENQLGYIFDAIDADYDVEIDVWKIDNKWWFGHDKPLYEVHIIDLQVISPFAWFHAKNYDAYVSLAQLKYNVFAHDQDPFAITSKGWVWSHRGCENPYGIVVMPSLETEKHLILNCAGVCHDYLLDVEDILANNSHNI